MKKRNGNELLKENLEEGFNLRTLILRFKKYFRLINIWFSFEWEKGKLRMNSGLEIDIKN